MRTCLGCRCCVPAAELLRVVVAPGATTGTGDRTAAPLDVVPDPRRRAAGRGAWVHPDPQCVAVAVRRRAFARALRVPGPLDPERLTAYVAAHRSAPHHPTDPTARTGDTAP